MLVTVSYAILHQNTISNTKKSFSHFLYKGGGGGVVCRKATKETFAKLIWVNT